MTERHQPTPVVTPLGDGRFMVDGDGRQRVAFGAVANGAVWVFVDGEVWVVGPPGDPTARVVAVADDTLAAPMPARVASIAVRPGQAVTAGDVLVTLEAMKMELPVRAPRDATIKAISCQTGRMVAAGERLVELD